MSLEAHASEAHNEGPHTFNTLFPDKQSIEQARNIAKGVAAKILMKSTHDADVEDIAQQVMMNLWQKAHTFKGNSSVKTWVYRIAANETKAYLIKIHRPCRAVEGQQYFSEAHEKELSDGLPSPLEELIAEEQRHQIAGFVSLLHPYIHEYFGDERTAPEIAVKHGASVASVKSCILRETEKARRILARFLNGGFNP